MNIAIVRGKFLNAYEMQFFEPLISRFKMTAFGSLTSYHSEFTFPVVKLPSPMDAPDFLYKMPILNRLFVDAHYLLGLEERLRGFDLVHTAETYYHYTQQCLNAKRKGYVKKVIATVLETIPFNNEGIWGRKAFKARARQELDHIIALTKRAKASLIIEGADPQKISVISHFIDTKKFIPAKRVPSKKITILFSGRLETYKGVLDLLEVSRKLLRDPALSKHFLEFIFVGKGSQLTRMIQFEKDYSITRHIKHLSVPYEEMPNVYRNADIFVAPSKPTPTYEEQYCTALLEAQSCGLAIVTTTTGGIPENIGNAGILVEPGNISQIAQAVKDYIIHPAKRQKYATLARARAVSVHDMQIGAKKIAAIYESVMRK